MDNVHQKNHSFNNTHQTTTHTWDRNTHTNSCRKTHRRSEVRGQTWCVEGVNCGRPQSTGKLWMVSGYPSFPFFKTIFIKIQPRDTCPSFSELRGKTPLKYVSSILANKLLNDTTHHRYIESTSALEHKRQLETTPY